MANPNLQLFLLLTIFYFIPTEAIYKSVCDCSKPITKGLLDLNDPYYCKTNPPTHSVERVKEYELITKIRPVQKYKAYTCSQWVKTKRIIGSFWVGAFDTTYFNDPKYVDPMDCWNMVDHLKCGGNKVIHNGLTYSFSSEPAGDGSWYSTKEYKTVNCLAEEIAITQETPESPIHTPFGYHNVSIHAEKLIFNHNTIVWRTPNYSNVTCTTTPLIHGRGKYSTSFETGRGRLLDDSKQIEILFNKIGVEICQPGLAAPLIGFAVLGLPDTFIIIHGIETENATKTVEKQKRSTDSIITFNNNTSENEIGELDYDSEISNTKPKIGLADFDYLLQEQLMDTNRKLYDTSYAWGRIENFNPSSDTNTLTSYFPGMEIRMQYFLTPELFSLSNGHETNQQFIYLIDQTIRKDKSNYCVTTTPYRHALHTDRYITLQECSRHTSRWIFDKENKQLIEEKTLLCLGINEDFEVMLQTCAKDSLNSTQIWEFENWNLNPEFLDSYPPMTIEDLEDVRREYRGQEARITINRNETLNFGKFYNGHVANDSCLASSNKYITDLLIMKNCTADNDYDLNFEYLRDGTIRPFQSIMCIHANRLNTTLRPCNLDSQKFTRDFQTAQFIERETRKCLQSRDGIITLTQCNTRRAKTTQRWQFEYNTLDSDSESEIPALVKLVSMALTNFSHEPRTIIDRALTESEPVVLPTTTTSTSTSTTTTTPTTEHSTTPKDDLGHPPRTVPKDPVYLLPKKEINFINATLIHMRREMGRIQTDHSSTKMQHSKSIEMLSLEVLQLRAIIGNVRQRELDGLRDDIESLRKTQSERESEMVLQKLKEDIDILARLVLNPVEIDKEKIANLTDEVKLEMSALHNQYKQEILIAQENRLAEEIRQVYCQVSALERNQAIIMAQGNGILAAAALSLPTCTRLQGFGQTVLLEQCTEQQTNITAIETSCGYQPYFLYNHKNYTIGMDGWSIHPFSDCFWQSHFVNINGKPYKWTHDRVNGDWVEQKPNLHSTNLELISEFEELPLNDFDFTISAHPAHEASDLEQLNVLNDLIGRIQETNSNSFSSVVQTETQHNDIKHVFTWVDTLKIMVLSVIGFVLFLVCLRIFIALNPFPKLIEKNKERKEKRKIKKYRKADIELKAASPMLPIPTTSSSAGRPNAPPTENEVHSHNHCTYVVGKGLVWEDLCPCKPDQ